jgi:endo-1,4-beta-xylanase
MYDKAKRKSSAARRLAAVLALFACLPIAAVAQDAAFKPVVVAEYGFEGKTDGWDTRGGNGAVASSKDVAHSGESSLKITGRTVDWHSPRVALTGALERGAKYRIELWVRLAAGVPDAAMHATMLTRYPEKDVGSELSGDVAAKASAWTKIEGDFTWDPGAAGAFLYVYFRGDPKAAYYVDDVKITKTAPAPVAAAAAGAAAVALDKFVYDFEKDGAQGWGPRGDGVRVAATAEAAHSGTLGLAATGRSANWMGSAISLGSVLKRGAGYGFSAYIRLAKAPASPSTVKFTMEEKAAGQTSWVTVAQAEVKDDKWVNVEGAYSFAAGKDSLTLYAECSGASDDIYTDDIVISMTTPPPAAPVAKVQKDVPSLQDVFKGYWAVGTCVDTKNIKGDIGDLVIKHFNSIVAENVMKPISIHPAEAVYAWGPADEIVEFGKKNNMIMRYHTLQWHEQCPNWFFLDKDGKEMVDEKDPAKREANKKLLLKRLEDHVTTIVSRYKDDIRSWDVVNEVIDASQPDGMRRSKWYLIAGKDFIETAFRAAAAAGGPRAKLYVNEYGTQDPAKRDALFQLVKELRDKGVPVTGVGHQMHIKINTSIDQIVASIKLFGSAGLDNLITELDMGIYTDDITSYGAVDEETLVRQGYRYKALFDALRQLNKEISIVIFWGINDGKSWLQDRPIKRVDAPLLFNDEFQVKPAYWGIVDPKKLPPEPKAPAPKTAPKLGEAIYGKPVIDGQIDDAWSKAPVLNVNVMIGNKGGATAKGRVMWDEDFLYVLMEVADPDLNDASSAVHEKDSVEAFVDENNGKTVNYKGDDAQYRVNFKNEKSFGANGEDKRMQSAAVVTKDGYLVEMALPFRTIKGQAGAILGFDLQVNDADDKGVRTAMAKFNDETNESWRNTVNWGTLKLVK